MKDVALYIKQSREELEGGIWRRVALDLFYMLEKLQVELDQYQWILVGERLPKKKGRIKYFVLTGDGIDVQEYRDYNKGYDWDCEGGRPTHWMEGIEK